MNHTDLEAWLAVQQPAVADVLRHLAQACVQISRACSRGAITGEGGHSTHGAVGEVNVQGENQQKLDVYSDDCMAEALAKCSAVAGWASEELEHPTVSPSYATTGRYLAVFDPLDGSSNIDANISVGTIFSVLPHMFAGAEPTEAAFMQPGRRQVAAGYALYGPATVLVLSTGNGIEFFTLDPVSSNWLHTRSGVQIRTTTSEFAINASNQRFWEKPIQRYVSECVAGDAGPRARNFNMRWVASMVAEVHRIMTRGGVFLYPRDTKEPRKPGRLRLLYEASPMAYLMEQAGAKAVTGTMDLLDVVPDTLHQRVPVIIGSSDEVDRIVRYYVDPSENVSHQLFRHRSLFVQPHP
jgi:fructose-1,6-bisphosphatase